MIQVNVTLDYEGQLYHTNVIASRETQDEEIFELAMSQIQRQWEEPIDY
ncbi:BA3454 family stress response protein [Oceanobacillus piezotolerans]|uniref:BA3454 family stress response protein n=1 Tax=Oceanobacillus piezotolerans TaxID=2448030 RepID=A0A498DL73_9BACI|nr:BA3454 family stress response protein [Oceanobacillus piezotolerans]RLL47790.1 BA3454 family stress response protein [Oceanobacillus piezotolerans]